MKRLIQQLTFTLAAVLCVLPAFSQQNPQPALVNVAPVSPDYFIPNRFEGKTILITGAARGIGKATAVRASREGANVIIADWLKKEGQQTADEINQMGGNALFVYTDVRSTKDTYNMVKQAVKKFGGLDYAVNNAGIMSALYSGDKFDFKKDQGKMPAPVDQATDEYWQMLMDVNATGVFKSMRAELKQMLKQGRGGAIVNVGSIAAMTGLAGNSAYVASKFAVTGITRQSAIDYAPYGIRINSVNMAATDTDMTKQAFEYVAAQMAEKKKEGDNKGPNMGLLKTQSLLMAANSTHRQATVWEQASTILYLLSNDASNITGAIYATDGGWTDY